MTRQAERAVEGAKPNLSAGRWRSRVLAARDYGIVACWVALFIILSLTSNVFLTKSNIVNLLSQQSSLLIIAAAGTLVVIAGGFDLSVGATFALSGVIAAKVALATNPVFGILAGIAAGAAIGAVNGILVTYGRIQPLIGTLASSFVIAGAASAITGGLLITVTDPSFSVLGLGTVLGINYSIVAAACVIAVLWFTLGRTVYGRYVFAAGGNAEAARLAGIRVNFIRATTFVLSGAAAGLGGVIVASQVSQGQADTGTSIVFTVLAAIVVGGTSILGGEGAVWRTCVGVLFIAMINNGFTLLGINPVYQQIALGAIILAAVGSDAWARHSAA